MNQHYILHFIYTCNIKVKDHYWFTLQNGLFEIFFCKNGLFELFFYKNGLFELFFYKNGLFEIFFFTKVAYLK